MTPVWTPTSGLPGGDTFVWSGRHVNALPDGLDEWKCDRVELYARLDSAPELVVIDALSFPWESLRPRDRDIPLVVALPPELDAMSMPQVLGDVLLRHLTPHDRLIEARADVRDSVSRAFGLLPDVWLPGDNADIDQVVEAVRRHEWSRLVEIASDIGTFLVPEDDLITQQLREYGAHQRGDLNALVAILRDDDVVLDIGAHVGTFAIPVAAHLGSRGRVIAIEAHPDIFRLLTHNIDRNDLGDRIEAHQALLAAPNSPPRSAVLLTNNTGGTWFQQTSVFARDALAPLTMDAWVERQHGEVTPTVIKLDVEGAELEILRGADVTVATKRPLLMVEVSRVQLERHGTSVAHLERWFTDHDYDLHVSMGARNTASSEFRIERLDSLVAYEEPVFDVIAVPRGSSGRPEVSP